MNTKIYFDNAATTKIDERVIRAMHESFANVYGNPASVHSLGQQAQQTLDESREVISSYFNVDFSQILFTSGATEANNMLLNHFSDSKVIVSSIEHSSIDKTAKYLQKNGGEISFIRAVDINSEPDNTHTIAVDLISCMAVNNETGLALDTESFIADLENSEFDRPLFHSDIVQALHFKQKFAADFLTITAHKIHGPKGIGALIIPHGFRLNPLIHGGSQEGGMRAGTVNVPGIVGLAEAITVVSETFDETAEHIRKISRHFTEKIKNIPARTLNDILGEYSFADHIVSVVFDDINAEELMQFLDMKGVAVSKGSACSSGSTVRSHVLTALNFSEKEIDSTIRFSFSKYTTTDEVDYTFDAIAQFMRMT